MKFRKMKEPKPSDDTWYDLCNGYINPMELLEDEAEAMRIIHAVHLIEHFIEEACEAGVLETM